ncbi:MAG: family 10 glycosylhydrolase [Pirellulales bacterium]|nr:family 10 glycosylhydrolase [Pirellulales bacterium]
MRIAVFFLFVFTVCAMIRAQGPATKPETRAIWAHVSQIDGDPAKGKAQIQQWADRFARANLNVIYPWVESNYLAAVEQTDPSIANAKWDALGELTRACVERGMQVQAWYSFTYYKTRTSPEFTANPAWRAVRLDELVPDPQTGKVHPEWWSDVCPMHPQGREFQINLLLRMLDRYPQINGIHVEEPGFGYRGNCFCVLCQELFRKVYGFDQNVAPDGPEATELKTLGTTAFMRVLRERLLKRDPNLVMTANGGYNWRGERVLGRDWARWAGYGWLDGYAAQIYVDKPELLDQRTRLTIGDLAKDCQVSIGFDFSPPSIRPKSLTSEQVCRFVDVIRGAGAEGVVFFHAGIFTDEYAEALRAGPMKEKVPPPKPRRLAEKTG